MRRGKLAWYQVPDSNAADVSLLNGQFFDFPSISEEESKSSRLIVDFLNPDFGVVPRIRSFYYLNESSTGTTSQFPGVKFHQLADIFSRNSPTLPETYYVIQNLAQLKVSGPTQIDCGAGFPYYLSDTLSTYPAHSKTIPPFTCTNLVLSSTGAPDGELLVDPGCDPEGLSVLQGLLANCRVAAVFLTHHHPDHVDALPTVLEANPKVSPFYLQVVVYGHIATLSRVQTSAKVVPVDDNFPLIIGSTAYRCLHIPGHTDGHMALMDPQGVVLAGDHVVGSGSVSLDATSGGSMSDYLKSCGSISLIERTPDSLGPSHSPSRTWSPPLFAKDPARPIH